MLKHTFVLCSISVVVGMMLACPCQAQLIDPAADVEYHPASDPTLEAILDKQILDTRSLVVGVHAIDPAPDPDLDDYYSDSHTKVFADLHAGASDIIRLDQFDPTRAMPGGNDPVGELRGVLLYLRVHLKGGRYVLDNETTRAIQTATLQIGANLNVKNASSNPIPVDFSASPYAQAELAPGATLASDVNTDGTDPYDGARPDADWSDAVLDQYSTGADKLAAIIDPNDPSNFFEYVPMYTDLTDPVALAAFTGNGTVDFVFSSSTYGHADYSPSQMVNIWPSRVTFDLEARLVYVYADAVPEPASMGLLLAALAPILVRRFRRRRKSPLG